MQYVNKTKILIGIFANPVKSITFAKDSNNVASTHKIRTELLFNNLKNKINGTKNKSKMGR